MRETSSVWLRPIFEIPVEDLVSLYEKNRVFLAPFEPLRPDAYFSIRGQQEALQSAQRLWTADAAYTFAICETQSDEMVGRMTLSNVSRGAWQNCTIGYFVSQHVNGLGYATEAARLACHYAFTAANLHRVQAAIMPRNVGSIRVIERAGFQYEGLAKNYLNIHGIWEDHHIYSITVEDWAGYHETRR